MALPNNTFTSFSAIGDREDLADIIFDISPMDTPFFTNAKKTSASATYHEWQTDALASAAANTALEGDDATGATLTPTTRVGNYCQILQKTVVVSGTQRKIDTAGRADEYSYQVAKAGRELKRDIEWALTQDQGAAAGGLATARQMASLESWLATNRTTAGTSTSGVATTGYTAGGAPTPVDASSNGSFTKPQLDAVIEACWTQGGMPTTIMCGPHQRTQLSGFTGISTLFTDAQKSNDVVLQGAVDFYKSNFGTLKVEPNRFQRDQTVFVLDWEYVAVATLRDIQVNPLSKTGDNDKAQILTEMTLEVCNEAASGKVTDCST